MVSADPPFLSPSPSSSSSASAASSSRSLLPHPAAAPAPRKPLSRDISSRYKSPSPSPSSRRSSDGSSPSSPLRSSSAERRRPSPSPSSALLSKRSPSARSELLWPSTRSMFSSMQADSARSKSPAPARLDSRGKSSSSLAPDHTLKPSANVAHRPADQRKQTPERKGTPLRRQGMEQAENARPLVENLHSRPEQHRWNNPKLFGAAMSRSVDLTADRDRHSSRTASSLLQSKSASSNARVPRPTASSGVFSQSINEGPASSILRTAARKLNLESRAKGRDSPITSRRATPTRDAVRNMASPQSEQPVRQSQEQEAELASAALADAVEDAFNSSRGNRAIGTAVKTTRGATVPARFFQDATGRSRNASDASRLRLSMPDSEYSILAGGRVVSRQRFISSSETKAGQGFATPSPWPGLPPHVASSFKASQQPLSPVKVPPTSPLRRLPSPIRSRGSSTFSSPASSFSSNRSGGAAAMLNFGAEARRGKKALTQVEATYLHRILHNRLLQWRFVNARAEFAAGTQRQAGEKLLFSVWAKTTELRKSVTTKRIKLQQARQTHKLNSILRGQLSKLDDWSSHRSEHSHALSGVVKALEAAVLRIPVNEGVRADTRSVKEAINSAVDVVSAVQSSITSLLPKLEKTNKLVSELAQVAAQERTLLEECGDLLLIASTLEVEERSLRTHLVQFEQDRARVLGQLLTGSGTDSGSVPVSAL